MIGGENEPQEPLDVVKAIFRRIHLRNSRWDASRCAEAALVACVLITAVGRCSSPIPFQNWANGAVAGSPNACRGRYATRFGQLEICLPGMTLTRPGLSRLTLVIRRRGNCASTAAAIQRPIGISALSNRRVRALQRDSESSQHARTVAPQVACCAHSRAHVRSGGRFSGVKVKSTQQYIGKRIPLCLMGDFFDFPCVTSIMNE